GFGAPIGGYRISPLGPTPTPTAEPLWVRLRESGLGVVTATWPGGDGADISVNSTVVQTSQPTRVTRYTVPFGTLCGGGCQGFVLTASQFVADNGTLTAQLDAAGHHSFSPVRVTSAPFESIFCAPTTASTCGTSSAVRTLRFDMKVAMLD